MPLTCSYLYLNKPNICARICLSNSVDSTQNINPKQFQSSRLIVIFKNTAIMPKLAWKHSPPYSWQTLSLKLLYTYHGTGVFNKKPTKTKTNPTLRSLEVFNPSPLRRSLDTLLNFNLTHSTSSSFQHRKTNRREKFMLTAKLGQLNLSNKTEAQAYMFFFFPWDIVYPGLYCTWRNQVSLALTLICRRG